MFRSIALAATFAAVSLLVGCNDAPRTAAMPSPASSAPPVAAVPTPPLPAAGVAPSETAKDTAANSPMGTLTKEEASKSMPMAGQGNNHSSPSLDTAKK
jgi:hypothetical protein